MQTNWRLIEEYKKKLKPGVYFLSARMKGSAIIGIEETMKEYISIKDRNRYGVVIAYYPSGLPINDVESLTTSVEKTPQQYQIKLIEYLAKKIRKIKLSKKK